MRHRHLDEVTAQSVDRLLEIAVRDTGQSRCIANFLLAWWNADECGGFDLTDLWGLDADLRLDVVRVFAYVAINQHYPDTLGWSSEFRRVIHRWRPQLVGRVGTPSPPDE